MLPPTEVIAPEPDNGPVEGLELVSDGLKCVHMNCVGNLFATMGSMEAHCRTHGWKAHEPPMWTDCSIQTFFKGQNIKYFEVNVEKHERIGLDELLEDILEEADRLDQEHCLTLSKVMDTHIVTKTPWLIRTGWERKFRGKDMKVLHKLTEKPDVKDHEVMRIWQSGSRLIDKAWKGVEDITERGWDLILFWLNSSKCEEPHPIPFRSETRDKTVEGYSNLRIYLIRRYSELWQRFLCFCYRVVGDEEDIYGVQFLREQRRMVRLLQSSLDVFTDEALDKKVFHLKDMTES